MTPKDFDKFLKARLERSKNVLSSKASEYATAINRFHNFELAAKLGRETREMALWGMAKKHLVSIIDMIEGTQTDQLLNAEQINEKFGDMINYLFLLEAMMMENFLAQNKLNKNPLVQNLNQGKEYLEAKKEALKAHRIELERALCGMFPDEAITISTNGSQID